MQLNDRQTTAVDHTGRAILVACPGSGKTRVIVERIVRLAALYPQDRFITVTFTRQAAGELRERLEGRVDNMERITVATFHSLALHQLIVDSPVRICGPAQQDSLLRQAARPFLEPEEIREYMDAVNQHTSGKASALNIESYRKAYDAYLDLLGENKTVDFSQGILDTVQRMDSGQISPLPTEHLLVDEVQDVDPVQIRWILHHAENASTVTAVGDDDQSIYSFRNSTGHKGMQLLKAKLGAELLALNTNYRSHAEILGLANRLIENNTARIPKDLYSHLGAGGTIDLHAQFLSNLDEAVGVADFVEKDQDSPWAIIARTNAKLDFVSQELRKRGIPHSRPGKKPFWESNDAALFLELVDGSSVDDAFVVAALCNRLDSDPDELPSNPAYTEYLIALRSTPRTQPPEDRIRAIARWLRANTKGVPDYRVESLEHFTDMCEQSLCEMTGSLIERLNRCRQSNKGTGAKIELLTMHAAKGREFKNVWIIGLEDGVVPSKKADNEEEERRLLYVAMTRAEVTLHLSFAWNRVINHAESEPTLQQATPSRFLSVDLEVPLPDRPETTAWVPPATPEPALS